MKLSFVPPFAGWIELKITSRTGKRKSRVGKRETRISRHRIAQPFDRFIQQRRISGRAKAVSSHEFRISQLVLAMSLAWRRLRSQGSVQCTCDLFSNFVFQFCKTIYVEVALPCEGCDLQMCIEHLQSKTPLAF